MVRHRSRDATGGEAGGRAHRRRTFRTCVAADALTATPPVSTYRLQLRKEFGFRDAAGITDYLAALGVTHVYCSPVLQAAPGSAHGYDVVAHDRLNDELGGAAGWEELVAACRQHGLGLVVDVVPNHMAVPVPEQLNSVLWDVLKHGRDAVHAEWFDIDWEMQGGKLLMPVLGKSLSDAIADGELTVDADTAAIRYFDHEFPIRPDSEHLVDDIDALLDAQHYRLDDWRSAATGLNYRRFFDVTSLIGVRVELDDVFDATHQLLLDRVMAGEIDGLRIDHPDGLADPGAYLDRLAERSGNTWTVVEKILEPGELLPRDWPAAGTTGYDAIGEVTHVLLDPAGERPLTDLYTSLTGMPGDYADVVHAAKRQVVETLFGAEVVRLLRDLEPIRADHRPDLDVDRLGEAIRELLVAFDVYRAYADDPPSRLRVEHAVAVASRTRPDLADALMWLGGVVQREVAGSDAFATRFAQTTGPVMAKGVEDTSFYRYLRLVALNEVGGDPGRFGATIDDWHRFCDVLAARWPTTLTTLTTHDTKRSEDVRARLLVIAERPAQWADAVQEWRSMAAAHDPVDANTDYLLWQTLVGAHPISADRLTAYLIKATREAKQQTSWLDPDEAYEQRLTAYVERVLDDDRITSAISEWVRLTAPATRSNVLSQKLLQLTMPGVADTYQGQEVDDRSLVDPDNRRPVDYDDRRQRVAAPTPDEKLLVTSRALRLRRDRPGSFLAGGYQPLSITGPAGEHAIAFARGSDVVAVATRLPTGLTRRNGWGDTSVVLPPGDWHDVLTDRPARRELSALLDKLPVALLSRATGRSAT